MPTIVNIRRAALAVSLALLFAALIWFVVGGSRSHAEQKIPETVTVLNDLAYGPPGVALDIYTPKIADIAKLSLPTVVWVHGGGWVGGSKKYVASYAAALAASGYVVVAIDYSLPPDSIYPTPVRQTFEALAFLNKHAKLLHVDPTRLVLAGDSAGAQIAAQVVAAATSRAYAKQLAVTPTVSASQIKGTILYSGAYDLAYLSFDDPIGEAKELPIATYAGNKNYRTDPKFATFSVINYLTRAFPPTFLSAGNADPFEPQSLAFAARLKSKGVKVDEFFFPKDYKPALPHVFQFDLESDAARFTLLRALLFLGSVTKPR